MIWLLNLLGGVRAVRWFPPRIQGEILYRAAWIDVSVRDLLDG